MKIKILYGFRGRETNERYYPAGEYELEDSLAKMLVTDGHAESLEDIELSSDGFHTKKELDLLRTEYKERTGKKAYGAWDYETLLVKLSELSS